MKSGWIENLGAGQFKLHDLPIQAQAAPLYGMQCKDINGDRLPDILLIGNDFGMETSQGRADAFNGMVLINRGNRQFEPIGFGQSGFYVPGDARALSVVEVASKPYFVSTENRKPLRMFAIPHEQTIAVAIMPGDAYAILVHPDNKKEKVEFSKGSSFLAQRSDIWRFNRAIKSITFFNAKGNQTRTIQPNIPITP
jgi:hypothetical protein